MLNKDVAVDLYVSMCVLVVVFIRLRRCLWVCGWGWLEIVCCINLDAGVQVANPCVGWKARERSQLLDRHIAGQVNESALFP